MKPTDLEKDLLIEFFKIEQIDSKRLVKSLDEIEVLSRTLTGGGFFTEFGRHRSLRVGGRNQSYKWGNIGGRLNEQKIHVGFLFHIEKDYIEMVEGFTYSEVWPDEIVSYELYVLGT